jgi:uncharacterized protein (TIGR04255 family)
VNRSNSYVNPPLVLALIEIRHPTTGYLSRGDVASLKQALVKVAPLQKEENVTELQMMIQPNAAPISNPTSKTNHRFLTRDRQTSITFGVDVIVIETTAYESWTDLKNLAAIAISARQNTSPADGVERVGIRFIDEIRAPVDASDPRWQGWVADSLLVPDLSNDELRPLQQQSVVQYALTAPGETLTLRYGAVNGPPVFVAGPNLVRADLPAAGPFFLLDTDAAWAPAAGQPVPELESEFVMNVAERLHEPVSRLFEELITEKLRKEVLNVG